MNGPHGSPIRALFSATTGFFIGFAAVALFGTTAARFQEVMHLSPMAVGFLVAMPALSGSLLRIPCAAWADASGARKPFLALLIVSSVGMAGVAAVVLFLYPAGLTPRLLPLLLVLALMCGSAIATFAVGVSQVSYWFPRAQQGRALAVFAGVGNLAPGLFSFVLPFALVSLGLFGSYLAWLVMLLIGTAIYAATARTSPYFQFRASGLSDVDARAAASAAGQELFPAASLRESLRVSARTWQTWALVTIYFTSFGGFIALTAWLPTYWHSYYGLSAIAAGILTGGYSVLTSLVRVGGGVIADRLREGGENTAILSLLIMLSGALVMVNAREFELALPGVLLLAVGMGICNAAVFKIVPQAVPSAVGGTAGWVGGIGAFGGFVIPPMMAFAVNDLGPKGYSIGFIVFVFLTLLSLTMAWLLKYMPEATRDIADLRLQISQSRS